jgi:hypothetical protein
MQIINKKLYFVQYNRGPGQYSQYSDLLPAGRSNDRIPVGARFFAPVQIGRGAHPACCTVGTVSLSREVKRPGNDVDNAPLSSPEVKETVELLLFSTFGPLLPDLGQNLP